MLNSPSRRTIVAIWLGWAVIMLAYQVWVPARLTVQRPDRALFWTADSTRIGGHQARKFYLQEPFLNRHVAWDSEYYLAIAVGGYEDPNVDRVGNSIVSSGGGFWPFVIPEGSGIRPGLSLNYAFFSFYPLTIRLLSAPLSLLGMNAIATATLAGVLVSLLGTLAAMLALFDLAQTEPAPGGPGAAGGLRAAFYLLIFPSGFFLAQVYTEGLFVGLAFTSLALLRRGRFGWAAVLAMFATFTRAVGVALVVPLLLTWIQQGEWLELDMEWRQIYFKGLPWRAIGRALLALAPLLAFVLWRLSYYGMAFSRVEDEFFGRGLLSLESTYGAWSTALRSLWGNNTQTAAYYAVEFAAILLGFTACLAGLRRHPDLAWFGLLVVFFSFTSGPAQGMHRYVLGAPSLFLFLSRLGEKPTFDRLWTLGSALVMGVMATLYTFDLWAG
jgi:hypothetical protein